MRTVDSAFPRSDCNSADFGRFAQTAGTGFPLQAFTMAEAQRKRKAFAKLLPQLPDARRSRHRSNIEALQMLCAKRRQRRSIGHLYRRLPTRSPSPTVEQDLASRPKRRIDHETIEQPSIHMLSRQSSAPWEGQ